MLLVLLGLATGVASLAVLATLGVVGEAAWPGVAIGSATLAGIALAGALLARRPKPAADAETAAGWREFRRELNRSRRHGYPLSLVRLPGAAGDRASVADRLAQVRHDIRRIDLAWPAHGDLYLLLPQTDRAGAIGAVARLGVPSPLGADAVDAARIAVFPGDGLTSGALIAAVGGMAPRPATMADHVGIDEPVVQIAEQA